jgi:DNA gyrase subunit A
MLALVDGEPKVLTLREMIYYYLEHQKDVIVRRTRYDLDKAEARAHILEGDFARWKDSVVPMLSNRL